MSGRLVNVRPKPGFLMDGSGDIIPTRQNVLPFRDRLTNVMSGQGTTVDRQVYTRYAFVPVDPAQAETAYRTSWLWRKIIDIPAIDMTRGWRNWQTEATGIEGIETEEKRLQLKAKCQRALILSRLFGGGAIILGTTDEDPSQPLNPASIRKGGLTYAHVVSRWQLTLGDQILDPASPWVGKPLYFEINTGGGETLKFHPSRVVEFIGQRVPEGSYLSGNYADSWFWGDPIMQSIQQALKNADLAQDGFASLIDRAAVDVFKFKDLMGLVGTQDGEDKMNRRVAWSAQTKSLYRAMLIDSEDEWKQVQISFDGMPALLDSYMQLVAGAADIPTTRLLGQSPKGLQSTGDGEERDYQAMIKARQQEQLAPALDRIDEVLIPSALGSSPSDVYYQFGELQEPNEKDDADIEFKFAQAWDVYAKSGELPSAALQAIAKNRMNESGRWPGSEKAFEDAEAAGEEPGDPDPVDPSALIQPPADGGSPQGAAPFGDANPNHRGPGPGGGQFTSGTGGGSQTLKSFVAEAKARPKSKKDKLIGEITTNAPRHVTGFTRVVNAQEVRKNLRKHGADKHPLRAADFGAIPEIVKTGTHRIIGVAKAAKPQRIEYRATLNGRRYVYIETVGMERRRVALLSLYVESGPEG